MILISGRTIPLNHLIFSNKRHWGLSGVTILTLRKYSQKAHKYAHFMTQTL